MSRADDKGPRVRGTMAVAFALSVAPCMLVQTASAQTCPKTIAKVVRLQSGIDDLTDPHSHFYPIRSSARLCWRREHLWTSTVVNNDCDMGKYSTREHWILERRADGYWSISPKKSMSKVCVNATSKGLSIASCNGSDAQGFSFTAISNNGPKYGYVVKTKAGTCVSSAGAGGRTSLEVSGNHTLTAQSTCGSDAAHWMVTELGSSGQVDGDNPASSPAQGELRRLTADKNLDGCPDALAGQCGTYKAASAAYCSAGEKSFSVRSGYYCGTANGTIRKAVYWNDLPSAYRTEVNGAGVAFSSRGWVVGADSCINLKRTDASWSNDDYLCFKGGALRYVAWTGESCASNTKVPMFLNDDRDPAKWDYPRLCYTQGRVSFAFTQGGRIRTSYNGRVSLWSPGAPDHWKDNWLLIKANQGQ